MCTHHSLSLSNPSCTHVLYQHAYMILSTDVIETITLLLRNHTYFGIYINQTTTITYFLIICGRIFPDQLRWELTLFLWSGLYLLLQRCVSRMVVETHRKRDIYCY